jgi:putative ABC transport system substrate-binding protein
MKRREVIAGALSVAIASRLSAQPAAKSRRLAIFSLAESSALMDERSENRYYRALLTELRRLGHVVGENLTIERYGRESNTSGPAALVSEVVRSEPDVVYVVGVGSLLFKRETSTIPIVALTGDPVAQGLIPNLARPGGNITGVSVDTGPSIHAKRIALLREIFPALSKLAYVTLRLQWEAIQGKAMQAASETASVPVESLLLDLPTSDAGYRAAISKAAQEGANAIMIGDSPDALSKRQLIAEAIEQTGLPAIYPFLEFVEIGGLLAYAFDLVELNKRVANDINAILRGANPGEIPFYQASKFELSINLKTAKSLGLEVPTTLLASAAHVIE